MLAKLDEFIRQGTNEYAGVVHTEVANDITRVKANFKKPDHGLYYR